MYVCMYIHIYILKGGVNCINKSLKIYLFSKDINLQNNRRHCTKLAQCLSMAQ